MIRQGDVYWLDLGPPSGSDPGYRHPHVVVQNNLFNASRIRTTVVCALTSNLSRAAAPGNVSLHEGEANLEKPSVINVSQVFAVDKGDLVERIGSLSSGKFAQVLDGLHLIFEPRGSELKDRE